VVRGFSPTRTILTYLGTGTTILGPVSFRWHDYSIQRVPVTEGAQKILIVEDEPSIADNISYALTSEGYETILCSTAGEAADSMSDSAIALMILDIGLPDKNGFDFLKEIRKESDLPVIILTSRAGEVDKVVGLEIGADDYIVKPFSPRELSARVKAVLRRVGGGEQATESANPIPDDFPFTVDDNKKHILYYEEMLELSRYEYRILVTLIGNPGWVFSRQRLMDLCWDVPESSLERTVDAHIKTLRAKLNKVREDSEPIQTHRGVGYSLREQC